MKYYILLLLEVVFGFQAFAQTTTRQDGLLYRIYESEEIPYAEVYGYALEDDSEVLIPDSIVRDGFAYPVTSIANYAFNNCKEIVSVTIGNNIKKINEGAFYECYNLKSVQMSDSVHSIGGFAFGRCSKLEKIRLSQSLDYIFYAAFSYSGLTELTLPYSLKIIAEDAFRSCNNLQSITIQSDLRIDKEAFNGCENIKEIYYNSPMFGKSSKNIFNNDIYNTATLLVPEGYLQLAYDTEPWLYFVHIKEFDFTSVNSVLNDMLNTDCDVEIYNFNGVKCANNLNNISPGYYIIRKGKSTKKIIVR